jgi:hypothetical protein
LDFSVRKAGLVLRLVVVAVYAVLIDHHLELPDIQINPKRQKVLLAGCGAMP